MPTSSANDLESMLRANNDARLVPYKVNSSISAIHWSLIVLRLLLYGSTVVLTGIDCIFKKKEVLIVHILIFSLLIFEPVATKIILGLKHQHIYMLLRITIILGLLFTIESLIMFSILAFSLVANKCLCFPVEPVLISGVLLDGIFWAIHEVHFRNLYESNLYELTTDLEKVLSKAYVKDIRKAIINGGLVRVLFARNQILSDRTSVHTIGNGRVKGAVIVVLEELHLYVEAEEYRKIINEVTALKERLNEAKREKSGLEDAMTETYYFILRAQGRIQNDLKIEPNSSDVEMTQIQNPGPFDPDLTIFRVNGQFAYFIELNFYRGILKELTKLQKLLDQMALDNGHLAEEYRNLQEDLQRTISLKKQVLNDVD